MRHFNNIIPCFMQIGCSNMRRFLFVLQGLMPEESVAWGKSDHPRLELEYLVPGKFYLGKHSVN